MSEQQWTVREILQWTSQRLASEGSESPLLDAQLLLGKVLGLAKVQLYLHLDRPLSLEERAQMRALVQRRLKGEPVAYLMAQKHWHDLTLHVDSRVLIPRPETETLLDTVLALWRVGGARPRRILDLCTGSGCLAIALSRAFPEAEVVAVDLSRDALDVARANAEANGATGVRFVCGDVTSAPWWDSLAVESGGQPWDVVVANPPYVTDAEWRACSRSVREFEPRMALVAEESGLAVGRAIVEQLLGRGLLAGSSSSFLMELGEGGPWELATRLKLPVAEVFEYSSQHPLWELPRGRFLALRDLSARPRFLARIEGLGQVSERGLVSEALAEPVSKDDVSESAETSASGEDEPARD